MLTFCQISFLFNFNFFLIILAINFAINYYQLISVMLRPQVFFTKSWKQQERFIPLLNFYELILYTLYIYIYYMWKNWNKGCIFYFFKFSRMLCWRKKKDEIFSGRLMMIIMPIITDLLKKMVVFFLITLFHVNVHYFHYHIVVKRRNILTNQSTYSCIFVLQESSQSKARSELTVLLQ